MRYSVLATGALALQLPACATINSYFDSRAETRFDVGLAALQRGDYVKANQELGWVVQRYGNDEVGQRALLAVAAMEMDPRNPQRRLSLGADLAGTYLRQDGQPEWLVPVAQTLYLLSMEMGAAEERVAQVQAEKLEAERQNQPRLPDTLSTVPTRLQAVREERDRLARKVEQLEVQLADRDKKLAEKDKELDRIRKTLKS